MKDLKMLIKKPLFWTVVTLVFAAAAVFVFFFIVPPAPITAAAQELYGNYIFKEQVYMNLLSSFLAYEGYEQYYSLTKDKLTITEASGEQYSYDIGYKFSEVNEQDFKSLYMIDVEGLDISQYKQKYQYTLCEPAEHSPGYTLYLMDNEIWLAKVSSGRDGAKYFWSIYRIEKYGRELPIAVEGVAAPGSQNFDMLENISLQLYYRDKYEYGLTIEDDIQKRIVEDVVRNCLLKSAAWPAVSIKTLESYIVIHARYTDTQEEAEFYIFYKDEKYCMQFDEDGTYSILDLEAYLSLHDLVSGYYQPDVMTVVSGENSINAFGKKVGAIYMSRLPTYLTPQQAADYIQYLPVEINPYTYEPFIPYINGEEVDGEYTVYDMQFNPVKAETPQFTSYDFEWPQTDRRLIFNYMKQPGKYIVEMKTRVGDWDIQYFFGVILPERPQDPLK